jgi:hypothetical protein
MKNGKPTTDTSNYKLTTDNEKPRNGQLGLAPANCPLSVVGLRFSIEASSPG